MSNNSSIASREGEGNFRSQSLRSALSAAILFGFGALGCFLPAVIVALYRAEISSAHTTLLIQVLWTILFSGTVAGSAGCIGGVLTSAYMARAALVPTRRSGAPTAVSAGVSAWSDNTQRDKVQFCPILPTSVTSRAPQPSTPHRSILERNLVQVGSPSSSGKVRFAFDEDKTQIFTRRGPNEPWDSQRATIVMDDGEMHALLRNA